MKIKEIVEQHVQEVLVEHGITLDELKNAKVTLQIKQAAIDLEGKSVLLNRCFLEEYLGIRKQRMSDIINATHAH